MVPEPDATMQPTPQDNQLMSKHRVLIFKPQLRLEWRGQHRQNETEQPDHSASLGDSITSSTGYMSTPLATRSNYRCGSDREVDARLDLVVARPEHVAIEKSMLSRVGIL
jgi:hypothetical protein